MNTILSIFKARFREFYRDRAALGWSFLFPFFIILAFYFAFSNEDKNVYTVGVITPGKISTADLGFLKTRFISFQKVNKKTALEKVSRHQLDMLLELQPGATKYWINSSSKNGYFLERMLNHTDQAQTKVPFLKAQVEGEEVKYLDWVFPGILAMNIMFSCLWGVGYSIVKYRQDGFLKRLRATPVKAYQFLLAQILARYFIAFTVSSIVFFGSMYLIGFQMKGSYIDLALIFTAGVTCLLSIGLLVASRTTSKEFADGILNLVSWPMMFLSGVWFSLESASDGLVAFSNFLPLTHMVSGMRAVMVDGANLTAIAPQLSILGTYSIGLLILSSVLFKWSED